MRRVYTLQEPVVLPKELKRVDVEVRDPAAADEITRVVATLTLNPPKCKVTPGNLSDIAQRNATLRENWTMQVLFEAGRRIAGEDTVRDIVHACVADGGACWKLLFDPDRWEERFNLVESSEWVEAWLAKHPDKKAGSQMEKDVREALRRVAALDEFLEENEDLKKQSGPPFTWLAVDIRTVYPVFQNGEVTEIIETCERPAIQTLRQYGVGVEKADDGSLFFTKTVGRPITDEEAAAIGPTVHWIEHWDKQWCTYAIHSGAIGYHDIQCFEHGYGQVPYFFAPGYKPNHWKGRKVGWGIAQTKQWLVKFRGFLWTLLANAAAQDVGQPLVEEITDPAAAVLGGSNRPFTHEQWPLNSTMHLEPFRKLSPLFQHPVSPAFNQLLSEVNQTISSLDTPRVSSQIGSGLEGAGFAISQVMLEARTKHNPYVANLEKALTETTEFLWHLVRTKVQETVWVKSADPAGKRSENYLGVGPDDLKDPVGVAWDINPEQPSAKIIESRYHVEQVQAGFESIDQAIEAQGGNPDVVRLGRAIDEARKQQWYQTWMWQEALQEMSRGDIIQQQAMQLAQNGLPPGVNPQIAQMMGQQGGGGGQQNPGPPDMANLQMSPGGAGAAGVPVQMQGGVGPGAVLPSAGNTAMVQRLGS